MANGTYKVIYMDNNRDKDKFRDNVNGNDNNNASQFDDNCNINTRDNDTGINDAHTYSTIVCSASSYTKRRRVKWKPRLTMCDARDTGQKGANTADLRETQIARNMGTIYTHSMLSSLPEALLKEPVRLAELTGNMEYVIIFEGDQGEGNGGPAQSSP